MALAERLAKIASWREELEAEEESVKEEEQKEKFTIPKVRFGRTEIEMPIVTCGGMRVQETWVSLLYYIPTRELLLSEFVLMQHSIINSRTQHTLIHAILYRFQMSYP